jgi:hypothetical protein
MLAMAGVNGVRVGRGASRAKARTFVGDSQMKKKRAGKTSHDCGFAGWYYQRRAFDLFGL